MTLHLFDLSARRAAFCLGVAAAFAVPTLSQAQGTAPVVPAGTEAPAALAPLDVFAFEIGHAARAGAVYTVEATQPATSKLTGQKVRLKIVESVGLDRTTRYFTLATGKHKTVAQLNAVVTEIFRRFLATPPPAANAELGKIGDLRYGGEVRFVVESPDSLRFDNLAPNEPPRPSHYSRADIEALLIALTGSPTT